MPSYNASSENDALYLTELGADREKAVVDSEMALDNVITSPHRRTQSQSAFASPSFSRQSSTRANEFGTCKTLVQRHRFLLTALVLLAFLCTVYLYFAVTMGSSDSCFGLSGAEKALCHVQQAKEAMAKGKLRHF